MSKEKNKDIVKKPETDQKESQPAAEPSKKTEERGRDESHAKFDRLDLLILLGIIIFTIFLRTYDLSLPDRVYFDETHYVPASRAYLHGQIDPNYIHPPLAKEIMAGFIKVFGDNTIGWRVGSVVLGTIMVIVMYLLGILMFRNRFIAIMASLLLSVEFLHIVQSRIATLDIYIGFFILLGYYFTWLSYLGFTRKDRDSAVKLKNPVFYLVFSAIFFGGATAVKISGLAGAVGAYLFLVIALYLDRKKFPFKEIGITTAIFALVMSLTFVATHIPLFVEKAAQQQEIKSEDLLYTRTFKFHYTEKFTHPYLSQMWQWPTVHRPIWYYFQKDADTGRITGIFAVGNLLFWWSFLAVMIDMVYRAFTEKDRRIIFILCGYLTLYMFWLSSASNYGGNWHLKGGFFYYMLPNVPFMALAIAETLDDLRDSKIGRVSIVVYLVGLFVFLAAFYPLLAGLTIDSKYFDHVMKIGVFKSWI